MYTLEQIKAEQGRLSTKSHGESVFTDIQEAIHESSYKSRWFWELLQNAKDAVEENESVSAKLQITETQVKFSHTGDPFKLQEILELIIQGSSKRDAKKKTGRFGTGFISTYVLSLKVRIEGVLDDGYCFDFCLDRDAPDSSSFLKLQETCTINFHKSLKNLTSLTTSDYNTSFTYDLNEKTRPIAFSVLEKLNNSLPYVLAFNEKIREVIIEFKGVETKYKKAEKSILGINGFLVSSILVNEKPGCEIILSNLKSGKAAIRVEVKNGQRYIDDSYKEKIDLFYSFPLIGSEELALPLVINSDVFGIRKERYGIFLGKEDIPINNLNKEILEEALALFPEFAKWCKREKIGQLYNLIGVKQQSAVEVLDQDWLIKQKREIVQKLKHIQLLPVNQPGLYISLIESFVPDGATPQNRNSLWSLYNDLIPDKIPLQNELEFWREILIGYIELFETEPISIPFTLSSVEKLCSLISAAENRNGLKAALKVEDEVGFLNRLYAYFSEDEHKFFFNYKIVFNQKNNLVKIDSTIKSDKILDETLKDILVLLRQPARSILCLSKLELPENVCIPYTKNECINKIVGLLAGKKEVEYAVDETQKANAKFLKWLISQNLHELIETFQVFTFGIDKSQRTIYRKNSLSSFRSRKQKLLAPKAIWNQEFPIYADMVHDKDCLPLIYTELLSSQDFEYLSDRGFIHLKPLIQCNDNPSRNLLRQLLRDPTILDEGREDKEIEIKGQLNYKDFAFFVNDEDYVFAANASSRSSIRILTFVLEEAVSRDPNFDQISSITINGHPQPIQQSIWVNRLKNSAWVYIRDQSESSSGRYIPGQPSSYNLAVLLNQAPNLKEFIKEERVVVLLSMLNVSVADLIRNTLSSEKERADWEKAFTALLTSGVEPNLVETMFKDPQLQEIYRNKQVQSTIIKRNQDLGKKLEDGFKNIFASADYNNLGIQVKRKPWGSDYVLTPESSDLINDKNEQEIFDVGGWFIELKATGRNYASMTPLQAKRAVENKSNYALVILPLDNYPLTIENIWLYGKVVTDIGEKLEPKYNEEQQSKLAQGQFLIPTEYVEVHIEQNEVRYRIKSTLWKNSKSIGHFLEDKFKKIKV